MNIYQLLEKIGSDTKRSHKISVIEEHKHNKIFLQVVKLALDPYVNFFIKKIPTYKTKSPTHETLEWALSELRKLSNRELTGRAGIDHLKYILESISSDNAIVIERVIGKDLRCGMADGIVNHVINDFIPTYPCLLARPYDEKNIKNIVYPAYSQLKADGLRANVIVKGGNVTLCGRSGRSIDLFDFLDADMLLLTSKYNTDMFYDGEFVVVDENENIVSRKIGNGIINKAIRGTISEKEAASVRFQMWDAFSLNEFYNGKSTQPYNIRFEKLVNAISEIQLARPLKFCMIPHRIVNNLEEAQDHFNELLSSGQEGIILKNFCGLWEDSRSKHLVKFKAEKDADLEVIGFNPGTGKFLDQVGSLICASSDRKVEAAISGFSDDLRLEITANIDSWLGSIVTVLYNERIGSKDKNRVGVDSLFLPRFSERRFDKSAANSSDEIK